MSTSDQHGPTLTRKQLREASFTGTTTVATEEREETPAEVAPPVTPPPASPLPRAAEPVVMAPVASADDVDLAAPPLTRRQARAQERVLTGSVPTQAQAPAVSAEPTPDASVIEEPAPVVPEPAPVEEPAPLEPEPDAVASMPLVTGVPTLDDAAEKPIPAALTFETPAWDATALPAGGSLASVFGAPAEERVSFETPSFDLPDSAAPAAQSWATDAPEELRPTVNASFGEALLTPAQETDAKSATSFDDLLSTDADTTGSQHTAPSALIYSQSPALGALSGPVASTGEILVTGTMNLPEGLGSRGHALGAADGKEVDAVLLDRELAPGSSPTPIAASSAISTIKPAGEVIRPPEPDKGNKVMLALTITAGALALALVGALVVAFMTGVFS